MYKSNRKIFLRNPSCRAAVISKRPLMREGLQAIMGEQSYQASLSQFSDYSALKPELLAHIDVVMLELDCSLQKMCEACNTLNLLQRQFRRVQWIFLVPVSLADIAIERLLTAKTSLLSLNEPLSSIIEHVFNGESEVERISRYLLREKSARLSSNTVCSASLTFEERRVLRLISKGWQIRQIATLLEKNYKTISAQKASAMRRLALKTQAQMYAWMISESGVRELNLSHPVTDIHQPNVLQ